MTVLPITTNDGSDGPRPLTDKPDGASPDPVIDPADGSDADQALATFRQAGSYRFPLQVSDGATTTTARTSVTVSQTPGRMDLLP